MLKFSTFFSLRLFFVPIFLLIFSGCSSSDEKVLPSADKAESSAFANQIKSQKAQERSYTLSQKKLLNIVDKQNRFLSAKRAATTMQTADALSQKRAIESLWLEYFAEFPKDVEAIVINAKFLKACGDSISAYDSLKRADSLNPNLAVVKQLMATCEAENAQGLNAYNHMLEAVKLEPNVAIYHIQLAQIMVLYRLEISEKKNISDYDFDTLLIDNYAVASKLNPDDKDVQWQYAFAFYDLVKADWQKALSQWEKILANHLGLDIERQTALANKARVLIELNRDSEASALLKDVTLPALQEQKRALLYIIEKAQNK